MPSLNKHSRPSLLACLLVVLALLLVGCSSSDDSSNSTDGQNTDPLTGTASGVAQKGPFMPGATARIAAFDLDGPAVSESVTVPVGKNGRYSFKFETLPAVVRSDGYELRVTGRFFNEATGTFSRGTRTLVALFKYRPPGNVNFFTTILAPRIKVLMAPEMTTVKGEGLGFEAARNQAVNELQAIFGLDSAPRKLNLLTGGKNAEDSANLLLFSAASLVAGKGQRAIEVIANDFSDDGKINRAGVDPLSAIAQAAASNPALYSRARVNLMNMYGVTPPKNTDGELPVWVSEFAARGDDDGNDGGVVPGGGDSTPGGGNHDGPVGLDAGTITGTVDGEQLTASNVAVLRYIPHQLLAVRGYLNSKKGSLWLIAFTEGLSVGSKTCGDPPEGLEGAGQHVSIRLPRSLPGGSVETIIFSTVGTPLGGCDITITRNDGPGGVFAGTFSGPFFSMAGTGKSVQVINGAFKLTLPEQPVAP